MGLYIKGMDMPTGDKAFHLEIHKDGTVLMWQMMDSDKAVGKAIPVPAHGRLIDADALCDSVISKYVGCERDFELTFATCEVKQDMVDMIENAPTIIPAKEE